MFKTMISHTMLEYAYGILAFGSAFYVLMLDWRAHPELLIALGVFNLLLRLVFESVIIRFDMHRALIHIEGMMERNQWLKEQEEKRQAEDT